MFLKLGIEKLWRGLGMIEKEKASEMFGVSGKNIQHFKMETPDKNLVEGWICKSRGSNMGSLIIDTVNSQDSWQFVRGMPKIKYLDDRDVPELPHVLQKEDGTNIVMFPLLQDGACMEVLFKTRLMPDCGQNWMDKIEQVIKPQYYSIVEQEGLSFAYELYGTLNKHETQYQYQDIPELNLTLLCALNQGMAIPYYSLLTLSRRYKIPLVMDCFEVYSSDGDWEAEATREYINRFNEFLPEETLLEAKGNKLQPEGIFNLYHELETFFEKVNMNFQDKHQGGIITEGAVWHYGIDETHLAKCKALSVREGHIKAACGIPHNDIKKAVMKGEEYFPDFEDSYRTDRNTVLRFIEDELLEEYPEQMVKDAKSEQKILSVLGKHFVKVKIDNELRSIVEKVNEEIGEEAAPADKMRCFAEMYPELRKMSGKVYQAMVSM
jgi:hypothetical protein